MVLLGVSHLCASLFSKTPLTDEQFLGYFSAMFIRLSYLIFYLRHAVEKTYRVILFVSIALVSGFGIGASIASMALCIPWKKLWDSNIPGRCIDIKAYYIAGPTLSMIFDIAIFALPIPLLWALKCKKTHPQR